MKIKVVFATTELTVDVPDMLTALTAFKTAKNNKELWWAEGNIAINPDTVVYLEKVFE